MSTVDSVLFKRFGCSFSVLYRQSMYEDLEFRMFGSSITLLLV